jgi:hypothetical protein
MEAKRFADLLSMEVQEGQYILRPHHSIKNQIKNPIQWKRELAATLQAYMERHEELYIVLMKQPNGKGELQHYIFDGIIFGNVTAADVMAMRSELNLKGFGFVVSYDTIRNYRQKEVSPYYARLVPLPNNNPNGIWIVTKYK